MSRRVWPSPIGDETMSTFCGRSSGRVQRIGVFFGVSSSTNSRKSRLTTTGSRACGRWPAPSSATNLPPVSSANRSDRSCGWHMSAVPCTANTGHSMRPSNASAAALSGTQSGACSAMIMESRSTSMAHPTQSSHCLVECGSTSSWSKKNSAKPRQSRRQ